MVVARVVIGVLGGLLVVGTLGSAVRTVVCRAVGLRGLASER